MEVLLAYEEYVNSREVELIIERERGQTVVGWVHACVQLLPPRQSLTLLSV